MSDKYISGPKEIATYSSYTCFSLCEFTCYYISHFKVPHQNCNCSSINNVLQEGKCLDPSELKIGVMPNLQLIEVWGHLAWPALIFKGWGLLSSHLDGFMLSTFPVQQWAPLRNTLHIPRKPMMGWQAQWAPFVWVFFSRSTVVCHWDLNKRARKASPRNLISALPLTSPHGEKVLKSVHFSVLTLYMLQSNI